MSKKAVIESGSKQFLVQVGQVIDVERLSSKSKNIELASLLVIDGDKVSVGTPTLSTMVKAEILSESKDDKVTAIRYKAKKRVKKVRGHRQIKTQIKITDIA